MLLVQAYVADRDILVYPLGLACLVACLGAHEVRTLDLNVCADPFGELSRVLTDFRPEAAGVSLRNLDSPFTKVSYYADFKRLVRALRPHVPGPLIIGGAGFSLFAEALMARMGRVAVLPEEVLDAVGFHKDREHQIPGAALKEPQHHILARAHPLQQRIQIADRIGVFGRGIGQGAEARGEGRAQIGRKNGVRGPWRGEHGGRQPVGQIAGPEVEAAAGQGA